MDSPEKVFEKPIFTHLLTGPTELWEGQHAHFEARVVPIGDPNMRLEWYVNGVELKMGKFYKRMPFKLQHTNLRALNHLKHYR